MEDKIKQVIVMRTDLNMRKGKMIAQGSHASMMFLSNAITYNVPDGTGGLLDVVNLFGTEIDWLQDKFTKICVQVDSEEELLAIHSAALAAGLNVNMVEDSGLTEFHGTLTKTCLAIGPDYSSKIDPITSHLKLL